MRTILFYFIVSIVFAMVIVGSQGCGNSSSPGQLEPGSTVNEKVVISGRMFFDKIVGLWQNVDDQSFERWVKSSNDSFRSEAFRVNGNDTLRTELAVIYPVDDNWVFENTVKGQNDGKSVKFTSVLLTEMSVQFSNPDHDFPTDINYTLRDPNILNAFIVGPNKDGSKDTIRFSFRRIQ
jgi:hypothetical protein